MEIIDAVPIFKEKEKKNNFLLVVGALSLKLISLRKAAEIMDIDENSLIQLLDSVGYNFSYLEEEDVAIEKEFFINWKLFLIHHQLLF